MKINLPSGLYRHYQGGVYEVLAVAMNADNGVEAMVIYKQNTEGEKFPKGTIWVRSYNEFTAPGRFMHLN